jgi:molybdate transport system substrate-binding protein
MIVRTVVCVLLLLCQSAQAQRIAAASDVQQVLSTLVAEYNTAHGAHVEVVFGSSGKFVNQIQAGAPFDIFLSADAALLVPLKEKFPSARMADIGIGRLAFVAPHGDPACSDIQAIRLGTHKIAIAHPDHAPYGARAKAVLQTAKLYDTLQEQRRIVVAESVATALAWVATGASRYGIVAWIQAKDLAPNRFCVMKIPAAQHPPLRQQAIELNQRPETQRFWDWMIAPQVLARFRAAGLADD